MKEILIEQHTACYDQNVWFVSLKSALEGVTAEQAAWKPAGVDNSIWENVNHIIFWNERWTRRYLGELNYPEDIENTGTFKSRETDWQATVDKAFAVMEDWRQKLNDIGDDKLHSPVNDQDDSPWWSPLAQQNIHNAYHIGQIVLLRKLQGAWDSSKGVS
jgi:uncharacterized damage-inducible protein DinB